MTETHVAACFWPQFRPDGPLTKPKESRYVPHNEETPKMFS